MFLDLFTPHSARWRCACSGSHWHQFLLSTLLFGVVACGPQPELSVWQGQTMGSTYAVKAVVVSGEIDYELVGTAIEARLAGIDATMSNWRDDSELAGVNKAPVGQWLEVSNDLNKVLDVAERLFERSDGAFDVTIAPALEIWGFGPRGRGPRIPSENEIVTVRGGIGFAALERKNKRLRKTAPRELDLSAIAPGFAADELAHWLREQGIENFLVDVGGELRAHGTNLDGVAWQVGVERPDAASQGIVSVVVPLRNLAVATSGDYRNFFAFEGRTYSHTFDARTAAPVDHKLAAVTVVTNSALWADGWATTLNVLGPEAGFVLAQQEGLAAMFVSHLSGPGEQPARFSARYTDAMRQLLEAKHD